MNPVHKNLQQLLNLRLISKNRLLTISQYNFFQKILVSFFELISITIKKNFSVLCLVKKFSTPTHLFYKSLAIKRGKVRGFLRSRSQSK
jgi:hypothetical protein